MFCVALCSTIFFLSVDRSCKSYAVTPVGFNDDNFPLPPFFIPTSLSFFSYLIMDSSFVSTPIHLPFFMHAVKICS